MSSVERQLVHHDETPALIFAAMAATIDEQLLPNLKDPSARAAAASMLQVLAQLTATVAWDPAPLASRLDARLAHLDALPSIAGLKLPEWNAGEATVIAADATVLEERIRACDGWVSSLVEQAAQATAAGSNELEKWVLGYGRRAAEVDLRYMAPSHLGKLTRKGAPTAVQKDSA